MYMMYLRFSRASCYSNWFSCEVERSLEFRSSVEISSAHLPKLDSTLALSSLCHHSWCLGVDFYDSSKKELEEVDLVSFCPSGVSLLSSKDVAATF